MSPQHRDVPTADLVQLSLGQCRYECPCGYSLLGHDLPWVSTRAHLHETTQHQNGRDPWDY